MNPIILTSQFSQVHPLQTPPKKKNEEEKEEKKEKEGKKKKVQFVLFIFSLEHGQTHSG